MIQYYSYNHISRTTTNPVTGTYNCGSAVRMLIVNIIVDGATLRTGGDPTYNGVTMILAGSAQYGTSPETSVEMWYLRDPPTGATYTISVPNDGGLGISLVNTSWSIAGDTGSSIEVVETLTRTGAAAPSGPTHAERVYPDQLTGVMGSGSDSGVYTENGTNIVRMDAGTYSYGVQRKQWAIVIYEALPTLTWNVYSTIEDFAIVSALLREVIKDAVLGVVKAVGYSVLEPLGLQVIKAVGYAVLKDYVPSSGVNFFVIV